MRRPERRFSRSHIVLVVESDLVSARGGLFALNCEQATRLLRIELDDNDQITQYQITAPRAAAH